MWHIPPSSLDQWMIGVLSDCETSHSERNQSYITLFWYQSHQTDIFSPKHMTQCCRNSRICWNPMRIWGLCLHRQWALSWRHNGRDSVSNHQPQGCLLNRLLRRRSKKTSKLRVTGLCVGNSPGPVNSPHKGPVTRKMFPFDDVIMVLSWK